MKSLEDMEIAFDCGLRTWEAGTVEKHASVMGHKIVREIKRKTKVVSGNLRRRFFFRVERRGKDTVIVIYNDADYAAPVNNGHRIVRGGKTVGMFKGHHMLERGIETYKNTYLADDIQGMLDALKGALK